MVKILVIEKDKNTTADICACLENNGFSLETVQKGITLPQLRCISYAMVLCELSVAEDKEIQSFLMNQQAPVLWLAKQADLPESVRNFRMGLEDYIVRPVGTAELLARIHMLMRCAGIDTGRKLKIGSLFLDADSRVAVMDGQEVPLTMREFNLLFGLLSAPEKVFSRKELMQKYWDEDCSTGPRAVDVYMTKLRDKFAGCKDFQIVTVHGIGYKAVLQNET